ncbi:sodium:proton antiporter [Prosthecobacter sp.]|uniref:sodium:proton antiporter n=1 Tax=Prosthecobacter sp. TaxID=1965333 RepID=UPI002AB86451|nr:sodium:proton antiporter [Prosthecobacter sp.]MDZ4403494.1 sodium:proton antiporter [Prosthecobacter sp.]
MILLAAAASHAVLPPLGMIAPFALLLLCIALMPLLAPHFWEHHYPKVAVGLGLVTAAYYAFVQKDWHPLHHAAHEYVSFMALVGSLFVISGGINIRVKGEATPLVNTLFLLIGAVLANLIGTTGASMLMIRPWIQMNKYRVTGFHIVFFIFLISNVGGALTPIGDPPLFLGFLRGVPFFWVMQHCWQAWALAVVLLLAVFYVFDAINFRRAPKEVRELETAHEDWFFRGLLNVLWLGVVLGAVLLPKSLQETTVAGVVSLPALVMFAAAVASYFTTRPEVHEANDFNFGPVKEVGYLFVGIFLTMIPALQILQSGEAVQIDTPMQYYFATGALSAFLDNAPTYLSFLAAAMGQQHLSVDSPADVMTFAAGHAPHLIAISLGAVFFGAGSYIGNGPNFMVKAIADKAKVHAPSFLAYMLRFSIPVLLPVLIVVGWIMVK